VQPTTGTSVPRVYEKMYEAIRDDAASSSIRERIFGWATGVGRRFHESESPGLLLRLQHRVADRLVFSKVRAALGGELEILFSGGGSLSPRLAALYHGMGLPMVEGYGLTETSPVVSVNPPEAPEIGTIGPPVTGVDVHVDEDVATESRSDAEGPVGELLVRGPNVTRGYWRKPEETAGAFLDELPGGAAASGDASVDPEDDVVSIADADAAEGWFRTGDIVERRPDGYLLFRDRLKELLVLSTGKNVAPLPIENAFATTPLVEQCMVVGDGEKFVGALIVPNVAHVRRRAEKRGVELPEDDAALLDDDRVRDWIQEEVDAANEPFEEFERIKRFELVPEEWTEANGMLTPTMKKKRRNILEAYGDRVDAIYEER
jgi:long-chain acyl-CoA synthetase